MVLLSRKWPNSTIILIDKTSKEEASATAKMGAFPCPNDGRWIRVEIIISSSIDNPNFRMISHEQDDWRIPILNYI